MGECSSSLGNPRDACSMDQSDGHIAQGSQNLRSGSRTKARTIFTKGDIADVVRAVLNRPMPPYDGEQTFRGGLGKRKIGNEIHDFGGCAFRACHDASQLSYLVNVRLGGVQIGIHLGTNADAAMLNASATTIPGFCLFAGSIWISKIRLQILQKRRLIVFDG
jgi:hypothetical protein